MNTSNAEDIEDSPLENLNRQLEGVLKTEISSFLMKKFGGKDEKIGNFVITQTFPSTLPESTLNADLFAGKVQVVYANKNYYIPLSTKYYKLAKQLEGTHDGASILKKIFTRINTPSLQNKRGKAGSALKNFGKKAIGTLGKNPGAKTE